MNGYLAETNLRWLDYEAFEVKYEFVEDKKPPALSVIPIDSFAGTDLFVLQRSDQVETLDEPLIGLLRELDAIDPSSSIFG